MFQNEGKYPFRPYFPALYHYRLKNFNSVGVVPGNGEEWYKFRQGINALLKTNVVKSYETSHKKIAEDFGEYIAEMRGENGVLEDVFGHLLKFTIEGEYLGFFTIFFKAFSRWNSF